MKVSEEYGVHIINLGVVGRMCERTRLDIDMGEGDSGEGSETPDTELYFAQCTWGMNHCGCDKRWCILCVTRASNRRCRKMEDHHTKTSLGISTVPNHNYNSLSGEITTRSTDWAKALMEWAG
jgi:hypothetical protein